jgi:hypothetical protein
VEAAEAVAVGVKAAATATARISQIRFIVPESMLHIVS